MDQTFIDSVSTWEQARDERDFIDTKLETHRYVKKYAGILSII